MCKGKCNRATSVNGRSRNCRNVKVMKKKLKAKLNELEGYHHSKSVDISQVKGRNKSVTIEPIYNNAGESETGVISKKIFKRKRRKENEAEDTSNSEPFFEKPHKKRSQRHSTLTCYGST